MIKSFHISTFLLSLVMVLVAGCFGAEKSSSSNVDKNPDPYFTSAPVILDADYFGDEGLEFSLDGKTIFSELPSATYTYSISNKPNWMSIDVNSAVLSGIPDQNKVYEDIMITATNTDTQVELKTKSFSLGINGDPLRQYMWHINNTGQKAFSAGAGVAGIDINSDNVYYKGHLILIIYGICNIFENNQ